MSTPIRRRRSDIDATDPGLARAILSEVQNELNLVGKVRPRIVLVCDEFTETLDLTTVAQAARAQTSAPPFVR